MNHKMKISKIKRTLYSAKSEIKETIVEKIISVLLVLPIILCPQIVHKVNKHINMFAAKPYIEPYEKFTKDMGENIKNNSKGKSNLAEIMGLMDEIWEKSMYGQPEIDIHGYCGLDIQNGVGVCRNLAAFASDLLKCLGYNDAEVLAVYVELKEDVPIYTTNINRKFKNEREIENENKEEEGTEGTSSEKANHAVVLIPDFQTENNEKIDLIIDPTNLLIGYLEDGGKIVILNTGAYKSIYMKVDNFETERSFNNDANCLSITKAWIDDSIKNFRIEEYEKEDKLPIGLVNEFDTRAQQNALEQYLE
ncbi:MAG TPA: hypothetical protein DEP72_08725 [Clostridiales bacterium]|nr:MAG: hypothetical protein A2Y18_03665 [Clostridiales bacterium GWD2_32_19]HCC08222.1 hypothetical protein [Clostridiales bacterium]